MIVLLLLEFCHQLLLIVAKYAAAYLASLSGSPLLAATPPLDSNVAPPLCPSAPSPVPSFSISSLPAVLYLAPHPPFFFLILLHLLHFRLLTLPLQILVFIMQLLLQLLLHLPLPLHPHLLHFWHPSLSFCCATREKLLSWCVTTGKHTS